MVEQRTTMITSWTLPLLAKWTGGSIHRNIPTGIMFLGNSILKVHIKEFKCSFLKVAQS